MPDRPRLRLPVVSGPLSDGPGCRPADAHANEFARGVSAFDNPFTRRDFLARSAAAMALAGVAGCSYHPDEAIVPYVDPPEQVVAGEPQFFATTLTRGGYGRGVIVTSREGRPVKIEGNPDHPASLGAGDAIMQASILSLYDPLRSKCVTQAGEASTWGALVNVLDARMATHSTDGGEGLAVLTGAVSGLTVTSQFAALRKKYPKVKWYVFDPLAGPFVPRPRAVDRVYDFAACDVIVSFDADFLIDEPGSLAYARAFADRRRVADGAAMNRLYVAESDLSITGTRADHRLAIAPSRVGPLLTALSTQMGVGDASMPQDLHANEAAWLSAVSIDLHASRGRSLVLAGRGQPPDVHQIADRLNVHLGNAGAVKRIAAVIAGARSEAGPAASLAELVDDLRGDRVKTLLVLSDNPARTAPSDLPFASELARLSQRPGACTVHLGLYANETAFNCQWHVPQQHELEMWSDAVAYDGTASLVQPLIAPLTQGKGLLDVVNVLLGRAEQSSYDTVRQAWQTARQSDGAAFEAWWDGMLKHGVLDDSKVVSEPHEGPEPATTRPPSAGGIEIVFRPDPSVLDGSLFHNAWLQELPRPLTKIVWGNVALISPVTAARHGVGDGDVVKLEADGRSIEIPVLALPGVADGVAVLHLGYGAHKIVNGDAASASANVAYGTDVYPLRMSTSPHYAVGVTLTATGRKEKIVRTHNHHTMAAEVSADPSVKDNLAPKVVITPDVPEDEREHNRKLIRTATLAQFVKSPDFAPRMDGKEIESLYPAWNYTTGPQWGMTIDLTACIGCNACITACQAENNTPSVGPVEVDKGREMHWLRVDSYIDDSQRVHHQPVPCMHCENAPCEYVCPVAATTHNTEGLNQMTYNRCVGTRYCSNNCPYKVRRFNFFNYTFYQPESYKMQRNPDVTVRTRGVMEKCTYCVQRINYADRKTEIAALNAGGDTTDLRHQMFARLQTACQQTCPTSAIHFGDLTDPDAQVVKDKKSPLNYGILVELTTKPRTTYLASITNPSDSLGGPAA